jgi:hypothetical protein
MCQKLSKYYNNGKLLLRQNLWSQQPNGKEVLGFPEIFLGWKLFYIHRFWPGDKQNCYLSKCIGTYKWSPKKTHMKFKRLKKMSHDACNSGCVVQEFSFVRIHC